MSEIIVNGGNPLDGCPKSWKEANAWINSVNEENVGKLAGAKWEYDCGFKLDLDGDLLRVSSRFYPPKSHYGETWDGTVAIFMGENQVCKKEFDCHTLAQLRKEVEIYLNSIIEKVKSVF